MHVVADIDRAGDDLAADAETEVGFVPGADDADEVARRAAGVEGDTLHLHRTPGVGRRRRLGLAGSEQERGGEHEPAPRLGFQILGMEPIMMTDD